MGKVFSVIDSIAAVNTCDQYWTYFVDTLEMFSVYILKFHVCEDDVPRALDINSNAGFR